MNLLAGVTIQCFMSVIPYGFLRTSDGTEEEGEEEAVEKVQARNTSTRSRQSIRPYEQEAQGVSQEKRRNQTHKQGGQ